MSPRELEEIFNANVVEDFQKKTLHLLVRVYRESFRDVRSRYPFPECNYLWGHERHAQFSRDWRALAESFGDSRITASYEPNAQNNYYFTQIQCGRIIMTASAINEMTQSIKFATFRNEMGMSSQKTLRFEKEDAPVGDAPIYALLTHSPGRGEAIQIPSLAQIIFPLGNGERHELHIDLLDRFAISLDAEFHGEEQIPDAAHPEIKRPEQQKGIGSA